MKAPVDDRGNIDYGLVVLPDAEDLAEEGIQDAYREIAPRLAEDGVQARPVTENVDSSDGGYSIDFDGQWYVISEPAPADSWDSQADAWGLKIFNDGG
jgi:hypothetical protein